jgi:hypothetical protein
MAWTERNNGLEKFKWWLPGSIDISEVSVAYQAIGVSSLAKSYINLVNPGTNDASPISAPTQDRSKGWVFVVNELTSGITGTGSQTAIARLVNTSAISLRTAFGYNAGGKLHFATVRRTGPQTVNAIIGYNADFTGSVAYGVSNSRDITICMARNRFYIDGIFQDTIGTLSTWSVGTFDIGNGILGSDYIGEYVAFALYTRLLTDDEIATVTANMQALNIGSSGGTDVNYIAQHPSTKHLNNTSHELLIAADGGLHRTFNGGRSWSKIQLPDPSNTEFSDSPAAIVEELTFHWSAYDPVDNLILWTLGHKASVNRTWLYKSTNNGQTWTSRGVVAT